MEQKLSKKVILFVFLGAFVFSLLVSVGALAYQNYQLKNELSSLSSSPPPKISETETQVKDQDVVKEDLYINEEFGFSLKIPDSWTNKYRVLTEDNAIIFEYLASQESPYELFRVVRLTQAEWQELQKNEQARGLAHYLGSVNQYFYYSNHSLDNPYVGTEGDGYQNMASNINQILSTFKFISPATEDNKDQVLQAVNNYLTALVSGDEQAALSYLTDGVKKDLDPNWFYYHKYFKTYEILNEYHSAEEESYFYSQDKITFDIKLYKKNDISGNRAKLLFVEENGEWKTLSWYLFP